MLSQRKSGMKSTCVALTEFCFSVIDMLIKQAESTKEPKFVSSHEWVCRLMTERDEVT